MSNMHSDVIVIGGGFAGLVTAANLQAAGFKITLVEQSDQTGGLSLSVSSTFGSSTNGLRFLPAHPEAVATFNIWNKRLGGIFSFQECMQSPVTFDRNRFQEFAGFADRQPNYLEEYEYFLSPSHLRMDLPSWMQHLRQQVEGVTMFKSLVTKILVEAGQVVSVVINSQKKLTADRIIYAGNFSELSGLVSFTENQTAPVGRPKKPKQTPATALCLDLFHEKSISDQLGMIYVDLPSEEEHPPCLGQLSPNQLSQWMVLVNQDSAEDMEYVAAQFKWIRRNIKKMFPTAHDGVVSERVLVFPDFSVHPHANLDMKVYWPGVSNLLVATGGASTRPNLLGLLDQTERCLAQVLPKESVPISQGLGLQDNLSPPPSGFFD